MTPLRLVESEPEAGPFDAGSPLPPRLPPGRHGIPTDLVSEHQRLRLIAAAGEALAEHGYARLTAAHVSEGAGVSSRTFYKHFENLWDCLLVACEATAGHLCERIEAACGEGRERSARLPAAIDAALSFLSSEPALARLVCARPPLEATGLSDARRRLVVRLAALLRDSRDPSESIVLPPGFDERLVEAAFALVANRVVAGEAEELTKLGPELTAMLAGPRRAA